MKQSLSISDIQKMFPEDHSEEAIHCLYDSFVQQYQKVSDLFVRQIQAADDTFDMGGAGLVTAVAAVSSLAKDMTQFLLRDKIQEGKTEK